MKDILIGESLVGDGNEIAHIDLLIGPKNGPVGTAFANALVNQNQGHTALLAVLEPNLIAKPATMMMNKVTIKGANQAVLMFGPAQAAVAKAVADSVADNKKIYDFNFKATKEAIARAMKGEPSVKAVIAGKDKAKHPFA